MSGAENGRTGDETGLPTATGAPGRPGSPTGAGARPVFGIKNKLSLAFLALAALTAIASALAWIVFGRIEGAVTTITEDSIPEITLALSIAELSSDITSGAPAIIASQTQQQRIAARQKLDEADLQLGQLIGQWENYGIATDVAERLSRSAARITGGLDIVDRAVERQLDLTERLMQQLRLLSQTHGHVLEALEPLIDDAVFDLVIESETSNEETGLALRATVEAGAMRLNRLATAKSEIGLLAGLLREVADHGETIRNTSVVVEIKRAEGHIGEALDGLRDGAGHDALRRDAEAIMALAHGTDGFLSATTDAARHETLLTALSKAQDTFIARIDPMISDTRDHLVEATASIADRQAAHLTELIDRGSFALLQLLSLRAEGNLAAGLLSEAASTADADLLTPLNERFDAAAGQMDRALKLVPESVDLRRLRVLIAAQLDLGRDEDGMFSLKRAQLAERETALSALDDIRTQSVALGASVARLVSVAQDMSDKTAGDAQQIIASSRIVMVLLSVAGIAGALLAMFAFVGPRVVRPIEETTRAMTRLAAGDTSVDIPGRDRQDELGHMAHALGVFRDMTIEVQESNLREIETTRRRLSDAIESISEAFSLYDKDDRLVVCNRKYGTLVHPEIAEEIHPGLTFEQIIRRAVEAGFLQQAAGREEEWITERLRTHRDPGPPHIMQRTDGIWIMVSERKTAEGGIVAVYSDITEMKERENELAEKSRALEQLSSQLSKYLSPQVYQSIFTGQQAAVVASKRKKLTVFFSDLEGFTETADRLESEDLSQLLNSYLTEMSEIALAHGATIDKYVGDAIMIFFGDPVSRGVREDALACVRMAMDMQDRLKELSPSWSEYGLSERLQCRMGIATGFCTVGNFGSEDRMDYTIIGGAVNLASRLEGAAEPGAILISGETYNLVRDEIACREHGTVKIKGLAYPVKTYGVVRDHDGPDTEPGDLSVQLEKLAADLDPAALGEQDRRQAAGLLREVIDKLTAPDHDKG